MKPKMNWNELFDTAKTINDIITVEKIYTHLTFPAGCKLNIRFFHNGFPADDLAKTLDWNTALFITACGVESTNDNTHTVIISI